MKTFLLGVGSQRSGTTWLYNYLHSHYQANMGFLKEYHIFDALTLAPCEVFKYNKSIIPDFDTLSNDLQLKHQSFIHDTENYFDYFDELYETHASNGNLLVGDITPSYSGLSLETFTHIKESLQQRGFCVKVIFIMRDPVDRIWSQTNMRRRDTIRPYDTANEDLLRNYQKGSVQLRTRYDLTIENLEKVFSSDNLHYAFYEELFCPESIRCISNFLGLKYIRAETDLKINQSTPNEVISDQTIIDIVDFYKETYSAINQKFGMKIDSLWKSNHIYKEIINVGNSNIISSFGASKSNRQSR